MAQPPSWSSTQSYSTYAQAHPATPFPPASLDTDFGNLRATIVATLANLAVIQRDDTKLANQSVHPDALSTATLNLIGEWTPRGDWVTATRYYVRDMVTVGSVSYVCAVEHVSDSSFALDLARDYWQPVNGTGSVTILGSDITFTQTNVVLGRMSAGGGAGEEIPFTAVARQLADDGTFAAMRTTLGLQIGVDVQAWDADLDAIAALGTTGFAQRTGANTWSLVSSIPMAIGATVTGGSVGAVLFIGAGPVLAQDVTNLYWDDLNNRLAVGPVTPGERLHVGSGNIRVDGQALIANKVYPGSDAAALQTTAGIYGGSGVPNNANGSNGDYYFRGDTPGTSAQRLYIKAAGAWASAFPAGGIAIGDAVGGGTLNSVLYVGAGGLLAQENANFAYDESTDRLLIGPGGSTLFSTATGNLGFGATAGDSITTGDRNILFGTNAGTAITDGADNVVAGNAALDAGASVLQNVAIGTDALGASTTSEANIAIGYQSMSVTTTNGGYNIGIGYRVLQDLAGIDAENVAIGYEAMKNAVGAGLNVALGTWALKTVTGDSNVGIGENCGSAMLDGNGNTLVGASAGTGITTGDAVSCFGQQAGATLDVALNCTMIGQGSDGTASGANQTSLGYQATCIAADQITLGNASVTVLRSQQTSITALSDARDKRNVEDIPLGLDFINMLRPVRFEWNMRDGARVGLLDVGFIAQELLAAQASVGADWMRLVYEENPDRLEATPGRLFPVMVRAIQELSARVQALEAPARAI